ncbi:BQ2448_3397 [Microbotryum intermedium]|uniref:BQ2448_3397 protein n=1 Tax=Microbotryum intermedium TaxID=269621 RepID=A0A238FBR4_9BASI|nr:BQ2448_3397 [Microbotryum intermedium]
MKPRLPALITPPGSPGGAGGAGSAGSPRRAMAKMRHASIVIARSHSKFTYFRIVVCVALTATFIFFVPSQQMIQRVRSRVEAELASRTARVGRQPWALDDSNIIHPHDRERHHRPQLRQDKQKADMTEGEDGTSRGSSSPPSRFEKIYKTVDRPLSENEKPSRCKRTLLFKMAGLHGFGSEVLMLARMAVLAEIFHYSLLIDSSGWNYGSWESVFQNPALDCEPPPPTTWRGRIRFDRKARMLDEAAIRKSWATVNHVVWSTRDNAGLDRALLDILTSSSEMDSLHKQDLEQIVQPPVVDRAGLTTPGPKIASQLVPSALQDVFTRQTQSLSNLWRLSRQAAVRVRAARASLQSLIRQSRVAQQICGDASPIVIGMHVRLGDKYREVDKIGPQALKNALGRRSTLPQATPTKASELDDRAIKKYLTAATTLVERIRRSDVDVSFDERPVLLIASDSPTASTAFAKHKLGRAFNVIDIADLERSEAPAPNESPQGKDPMLISEIGFDESKFNMLPLEDRERVAQGFVRDITILDQVSHGLVMSASSNVGRMLAVLGGEQKIEQGLIASVDTR